MSLDVYLIEKVKCENCGHECSDGKEVYWANITHNLGQMAEVAGIYKHLWRPEEIGITKAKELIEPLTKAIKLMREDRVKFELYNASDGWGLYIDFVPWIQMYLDACIEHPEAYISVSR